MNNPMRIAAAIALALGATIATAETATADSSRWGQAHGWQHRHQHRPPVHAYPPARYFGYPPPAYYPPPRVRYYAPPPIYWAPPPPVFFFGGTIW